MTLVCIGQEDSAHLIAKAFRTSEGLMCPECGVIGQVFEYDPRGCPTKCVRCGHREFTTDLSAPCPECGASGVVRGIA